jgi:hypothetical protein
LFDQNVAATIGFVFQFVLSIAVIIWILLRRSGATEQDGRLSLAALFCVAAAFSPVSWLEYYMALEVPYMALTFVACSSREREIDRARARIAQFVLAGSLLLNVSTRLFEAPLYYGVEYFGSLMVLAAILILTGMKRP